MYNLVICLILFLTLKITLFYVAQHKGKQHVKMNKKDDADIL